MVGQCKSLLCTDMVAHGNRGDRIRTCDLLTPSETSGVTDVLCPACIAAGCKSFGLRQGCAR